MFGSNIASLRVRATLRATRWWLPGFWDYFKTLSSEPPLKSGSEGCFKSRFITCRFSNSQNSSEAALPEILPCSGFSLAKSLQRILCF